MGKIKKERKHETDSKFSSNTFSADELPLTSNKFSQSYENVFSRPEISYHALNYTSDKFDSKSVVSNKSRKELKEEEQHLKKKEKQKLRKDRFMDRLSVKKTLMKKPRVKKRKRLSAIVGDMSSLIEALPTLESLSVTNKSSPIHRSNRKPKGTPSIKQKQKQRATDVKLFKKILNDKIFRTNPAQTITEYLKQRMAAES